MIDTVSRSNNIPIPPPLPINAIQHKTSKRVHFKMPNDISVVSPPHLTLTGTLSIIRCITEIYDSVIMVKRKKDFHKCMICRVVLLEFYVFHHNEDELRCHKIRNIYPCGTYDAILLSLNPKAFILN